MNVIRRNADRRHIRSGPGEMWLTFYPQEPAGSLGEGFGIISILNESILSANEGVASDLKSETELITYVHKGALALVGPMGHSGVITAGEFQCITIGRTLGQRVTNTSLTDSAHFFRVFLRLLPSQLGTDCMETQSRFTVAQRRNVLCAVATTDVGKTSIRIITDARIYSSILDPGQHMVHELFHGRKAWLHIVHGKVRVNEVDLAQGDGMGITDEPSISLTVQESAELLLVDTISGSSQTHHGATRNEIGK
jgi:redox-sensitive bicupin YhaK (pirin superfamily)